MSDRESHNLDPSEIYQNALCGFVSIDNHGVILQANNTLLQWLGFEKEEVIEKQTFPALLTMGGKIYFETHLMPLLQMQGGFTEVQLELRGANDKRIPVLLNAIGSDDGDPKSIHYHFTIIDITYRKRYEKELLLARKDAEDKAQRLREINEDLERFAHTASHDLQAPLRTLVGMISLLKKKKLIAEGSGKYFDLIEKNAKRMRLMVHDLLDHARVDKGNELFDLVDLNEVCEQAREALAAAEESDAADYQIETLPKVSGSEIQLVRLFQNLFSNAIKYRSDSKPLIKVESAEREDFYAISVSDNGIGFEQEHAERIFEFMERLHSSDKIEGTGIGLSSCKRIVKNHGGEIWATSSPGKGSTFTFTLPISK